MSALVVLDGSTFFVSDELGDTEGEGSSGFFFRDTRHLSRLRLLVNGEPLRILTSKAVFYYAGRVFGTIQTGRNVDPRISIQRDRLVADGIHEDIVITNNDGAPHDIEVALHYGADFADAFELDLVPSSVQRKVLEEVEGNQVILTYEKQGFRRATRILFSTTPTELSAHVARFSLVLEPRQEWVLCFDVFCQAGGQEYGPRVGHGGFGQLEPQMPETLGQWLDAAPQVDTDAENISRSYHQSLLDLAALRFRPVPEVEASLPAAGLPWFMALFGRDSLITAYQALPFHPELAAGTLATLAHLQAASSDDFRDADPGKIPHELRFGELTALGNSPHSPYYGSHDATPLFLILLDEYERWTGDTELVRRLEPAARAALEWVEGPGDPDNDGYLEYQTRSSKGLVNQGWKDSWDAIAFADGRLAKPPIATCELQGYAYDARRRTARLARQVWGDVTLADRLERDAIALREQFNSDFWLADRGCYALALDGTKQPVDSLSSNVGHLLWSGIVDEGRAGAIADMLMSPEMWSGWGLRTMSSDDAAYNPIGYHTGTVWPHDTSICAEGLRIYGFHQEAVKVALALFEAAATFDYRLPEVFAGFSREATAIPVEYPTPCRPQAWASGAPLLALRTLLRLDPGGDELHAEPSSLKGGGHLGIRGVRFRGKRIDVA
ncbi:MAG: amylo-alpha-1,6-glucosidase [Acidimicrobiales bacterium]